MVPEQLVADETVLKEGRQLLGPQVLAPLAQLGFGVHAFDQLVERHGEPVIPEFGKAGAALCLGQKGVALQRQAFLRGVHRGSPGLLLVTEEDGGCALVSRRFRLPGADAARISRASDKRGWDGSGRKFR
jgi:hypothetical protein